MRYCLAVLLLLPLPSAAADVRAVEITPTAIESFRPRSAEKRFGELEYRGGFSFRASDRQLGGISSFRFRDAGSRFLAVTDTGLWFEGRIERNDDGRPSGITQGRIAPILTTDGAPARRKGDVDAEGLAIDGERVLVSFEQQHRIEAFDGHAPLTSLPSPVAQPIPTNELRANQGLETVAVSPDGTVITVAEYSIDRAGNLFAGILGPDGGIFTVRREPPWHATDGAFLPDGDFLLLERRYERPFSLGMRIRRIPGATIQVGALVDGPVIMEADLTHEIDNMEGLDVYRNERGEIIVALVSDDNLSFLQRNLYLEFRLVEDEDDASG